MQNATQNQNKLGVIIFQNFSYKPKQTFLGLKQNQSKF